MRRLASSRPRWWGMETISGLDNSASADGNVYIATRRSFNRHSGATDLGFTRDRYLVMSQVGKADLGGQRRARNPCSQAGGYGFRAPWWRWGPGMPAFHQGSFGATASASTDARSAATGRAGRLMAGRVAGGAGLAGFAALALHLMAGRVAGGSGLARHRAMLLHALAGRVPLGRAFGMADRGGRDQQTRGRGNRESFAHHESGLLRFAFHCGSRPQCPRLACRQRERTASRSLHARGNSLNRRPCNEAYCEAAWTVCTILVCACAEPRARK